MAGAVGMARAPSESRDLVPYGSDARQVVLRHGNTVVVFDEQSRQLSATPLPASEVDECPYCHRPFDPVPDHADDPYQTDEASFISPQYFRQLAASTASSARSSRPVSPARRLSQFQGFLAPAESQPTDSTAPAPISASTSAPGHGSKISAGAFSQGYFDRFFITQRELGRGGRGVVLLVKHVLDRVELGKFACKRIPVGDSHEWLEKVLMEVTLLQNISHENLVPYRHVWLEDFRHTTFAPSTPHVFILQQYCNSGTLLEYVLGPSKGATDTKEQLKERARRFSRSEPQPDDAAKQTRRMQFEEIFSFFKDITSGLAHLHASGFVHRDLKPQNCLLHRTNDSLRVLVSDFGEMQGADTPRQASATGYTGTVSFAAPEVLSRSAAGELGNFTPKSDVFSLGMIVFFMCFARLPYSHADLDEEKEDLDQLKKEVLDWTGLRDERRERIDLPEKLYGFLKLLLSREPSERPSTESILQGIRAGSAFSEFTSTSPLKEHFESPERFQESSGRATSPETSNLKRRTHLRSYSTDKASSRFSTSPDMRPAKARTGMADEQSNVALAEKPAVRGRSGVPMIMAPPRPGWRQRARSLLHQSNLMRACKLLLFLGKVWTLTSPCHPELVDAAIAYPLLAVAALDLLDVARGIAGPLLFALVHALALFSAWSLQGLCRAPDYQQRDH